MTNTAAAAKAGVMHDEITTDDAKQRGDEAKSRQFAGGTCRWPVILRN
jgi:hypothetical protein